MNLLTAEQLMKDETDNLVWEATEKRPTQFVRLWDWRSPSDPDVILTLLWDVDGCIWRRHFNERVGHTAWFKAEVKE